MKKQILLFLIIVLLSGCKDEFNSLQPAQLTNPQKQAKTASVAAAAPEVYIPQELSSNDLIIRLAHGVGQDPALPITLLFSGPKAMAVTTQIQLPYPQHIG
jgi:hypothetical protein